MSVPAELRYTQEHEWVAIDGDTALVGITDYATQQLGDVVYVSPPTVGSTVTAGEACGEVESTKSVSELYSPVDGQVVEVNEELDDDPGMINAEPYGLGWIFKVQLPTGTGAPATLLSPAEYEDLTQLSPGGATPRTPRCSRGRARSQRARSYRARTHELTAAGTLVPPDVRAGGRDRKNGDHIAPARTNFRRGDSLTPRCPRGRALRASSSCVCGYLRSLRQIR